MPVMGRQVGAGKDFLETAKNFKIGHKLKPLIHTATTTTTLDRMVYCLCSRHPKTSSQAVCVLGKGLQENLGYSIPADNARS